MAYHLSRQRYNKDDGLYLEIAVGGSKYAGVDILTARYEGEQKSLVDPRDAVKRAEIILSQWDRDYSDEKKQIRIVGVSPVLTFDYDSKGIDKAKAWANKIFSGLKKCAACNKAMGNRDAYEHEDLKSSVFCTEYCCAKKYRDTFGVEPPRIASNKTKQAVPLKK